MFHEDEAALQRISMKFYPRVEVEEAENEVGDSYLACVWLI